MGFYNKFILVAKRIYSNKKIFRLLIFLLIFFILFCHNSSVKAYDMDNFEFDPANEILTIDGVSINPMFWEHEFRIIYKDSTGYGAIVSDYEIFYKPKNDQQYPTIFYVASPNYLYNKFFGVDYPVSNVSAPLSSYYKTRSLNSSTALLSNVIYSSEDIYDENNELVYPKTPTLKNPEIATSTNDLQTLNFDVLSVNGWSYSSDDLYLLCYDKNSQNMDSPKNLYPVNEILLNQESQYFMSDISSAPDTNSIYWIPKEEIGFDWKVGGTYAFRFALRVPPSQPNEYTDWVYDYLTEPLIITIDSNVSSSIIDDLNNDTQDAIRDGKIDNINNSISQGNQQNQQFYNNILSNDYNQNQAGDTLNNVSSSSSQIDDSNYTGLFSTIFSKLSTIFNSDYNNVSTIEIPYPYSQQKLILRSDIVENRIKHTFLGTFIQTFWLFSFGMYVYKFSYNIVKAAKDGSVLNGIKNQTEVITDSLL